MRVLVGMSGGVDSSVAAALLKQRFKVTGITLELLDKNGVCGNDAVNDAKKVCDNLLIGHTVLDLKEQFKEQVTAPFIEDYLSGNTPNPCIVCNKQIKFGAMLKYALQNGYDKIATGHYAEIEEKCGKFYLKCAADQKKDQTYFLYNLNQNILSRLLLPLGSLTKEQTREIAEKNGFANAKKSDSQDICFVPSGDYAAFIENAAGKSEAGNFIDKNGKILGKHEGVIRYTVGQRKGLGIALGHPAYVIDKNALDGTVTLGEEKDLYYNSVFIKDINFICDIIESGEQVSAKIRYSQTTAPCTFKMTGDNTACLTFASPQRAPASGQAAVLYKDGYCLGGGIIVKGENL